MNDPVPGLTDLPIPPNRPAILSEVWRRDPTTDLVIANMPAFIRLIKRQREQMNISQRRASELCEMNPMAFNGIENGAVGLTQYSLADILTGLGLTRADIVAEIAAMQDEEADHAQAAA